MDRITTKSLVSAHEIMLDSRLCTYCSIFMETVHVFLGCEVISVFGRCLLGGGSLMSRLRVPWRCLQRKCFDAMMITTFWVLWNFRSAQVFGMVKSKALVIFDYIVFRLFFKIFNRMKCKMH